MIGCSGCPEPREDHASNCVKMGLNMIRAIKEFDKDCHEDVNMRVGIHTGTVLCGIVGRKRFKFDVWSNDVTLANRMESTGKPGKVHVSESTYQFLKEDYYVEEGEEFLGKNDHSCMYSLCESTILCFVLGMKTFFITGLKNSPNQILTPHTNDGLEESSENNKHEPISQNGTKSLPSLGNNILVVRIKIEMLNFHSWCCLIASS